MRFCNWVRNSAICIAVAGMVIPAQCLMADQPADDGEYKTKAPLFSVSDHPIDVGLESGNILRGAIVNQAGQPAPNVHVLLFQDQQLAASGVSNVEGKFAIANLRGGLYQIAAGERVVSVRCWAPETAPPTANRSTLIQIEDVQRGQVHPGTCALANPWIIAGIAAAAIFIPVAIKANSDDRQNSSL